MKKRFALFSCVLLTVLLVTSCSEKKQSITFADAGWDSNKFHNAVAEVVAKGAFGYEVAENVTGSSTILQEGLEKGEIDVHMEEWTDNLATYYPNLEDGKFKEWGVNYDDNIQGIYVPRYVIEGDPERGIDPLAPDLKTVSDLKQYKDLFVDDQTPGKGRIYGGIPGWEVDEILYKKYLYYGLDQDFIYFRPGSDAALSAAITAAYDKGEPIAAYYWEPTWIMGKYDLVLLEDAPYTDAESYKEGKTAFPSVRITKASSNQFAEKDPEFCAFLNEYSSSSKQTSEALLHMQETGDDPQETARWFLQNNDSLLDQWLTPERAAQVREYLQGKQTANNPFFDFPFTLPFDITVIDQAVRSFSTAYAPFFNAIKSGLNHIIGVIDFVLNLIPWWLFMAGVFFSGWKLNKKIQSGILYALFLFPIGMFGLWDLMYETLAIVIASVIISLALGFPIGILVAGSKRAEAIARPVLDTMQTMPVFVYLIPAILFFGLGKAPAVMATTIYAIVPVIRLTSHGIRQVDAEVVEAAKSFGSTRFQTLIKTQIPQAMPTIMTGVNQTIMMAMAMVVTCSMIGASGLGMEVLIGVNRIEIGRGVVAGTAVVIVAVILDRITQGLIRKTEKDNQHGGE